MRENLPNQAVVRHPMRSSAMPLPTVGGLPKIIGLALIILISTLLQAPVEATPILDQNAPDHRISVMHRFSTPVLAQSFQQNDDNIAGAGLWVSNYLSGGASATITISLWNSLSDVGGTAMASGSATHAGNGWVDIFWSPVSVIPYNTMYLVFQSTNGAQGLGGSSNGYARGNLFANALPTIAYDFAFRTYSDPEAMPVPESSTTFLLLAGLAGAGFTRRRRQGAAV